MTLLSRFSLSSKGGSSDSTLPTLASDSDDDSLSSGSAELVLRRPSRADFFLEPRVSHGAQSLPVQLHARKFLKFLILVPISAVAMMCFSALYVTPLLRAQGVYTFFEESLWRTLRTHQSSFCLLVVLPLLLALCWDILQEGLTMLMLWRGRGRRLLPNDRHRLVHAIIVCNYKEPVEVLRATIESIAENTLAENCMVVLACEERDSHAEATFQELRADFPEVFRKFVMTRHQLVKGEVVGKSSNENFACREVYRMAQEEGLDPFNVMVTTCDADSLFDRVYFEQLEAEFCRMPDGRRFIYNAPINTYRNLPECNLMVKIFEISRCQFDCFRGFNFRPAQSNYSLTLGFANEIGFWDPSNTSEDFHTTIKAMAVTGKGTHVVVPVWSFILNDSVCSFYDRWVQAKRHMWGIEEVAFTVLLYPTLRINLWLRLFGMVATQMFSTCTPPFLYAVFPTVRDIFWSFRPETQRVLVGLVLARVVYSWAKTMLREVFLYRCILNNRKLMMPRSWCEWIQIATVWPVLSELSVVVFACLATWRVLLHAVFHETLHYVTAPKALSVQQQPKKAM